jgi:Acetoacetate decarboxylase (ADC)
MSAMIYARDKSELKELRNLDPLGRYYAAESLSAVFRTDQDVVNKILPKPLKHYTEPLGMAAVARFPETNVFLPYNEGQLFLLATYKGEVGLYCMAMPVTDDMALVLGREGLGFPKKMAEEISLVKDGNKVEGRVVRKGEEIMRITGETGGPADVSRQTQISPVVTDLDGMQSGKFVSFLYKYSWRADYSGFDYIPRLIRQVTLCRPREAPLECSGEVVLNSSPCDPLGEIPVREVLWMTYVVQDNIMLPGKTVARAWNMLSFASRALWKSDPFFYWPNDRRQMLSKSELSQLRKQIKKY